VFSIGKDKALPREVTWKYSVFGLVGRGGAGVRIRQR